MRSWNSIAPVLAAAIIAAGAGLAQAQTKDKAAPAQKAAPAAKSGPAEQAPAQTQQAVAIPSPWTKICNRDPQANKEVCLVAQDIRAETGQFLASVAVREVEG